jgi:hypothetical protein
VLDNALGLVAPGGKLVVITPAVWTLHNYPVDCNRLLPNWYEQYASTRDCTLMREHFDFIGHGNVGNFVDKSGAYQFPTPAHANKFKYWRSRVVQRVFNTYGRAMAFPSNVAIGAVFTAK